MKFSDKNVDLPELKRLYQERRPFYDEFAARLDSLLEKLLSDADIPVIKVESRAKTVPSFLEKVEIKSYTDPFEEIRDIAGLRIITYYEESINRILDVIRREFTINEIEDKTTSLKIAEFGYRSVHVSVSLSESRRHLPEWKTFADMTAEIQIRSIFQHAWAALSHNFDYKHKSQLPDQLRRKLFRLSALFELVDEQIELLWKQAEAITEGYRHDMSRGELDLPLNLDSLREFVEQQVDLQEWEQFGVRAGMEPFPQLEIEGKYEAIGLSILLQTLQESGIATIAGFQSMLAHVEHLEEPVRKFTRLINAQGKTVYAVPLDVLILLVSFSKAGAISPDFDWGGKYRPFIVEALRQVCQEQAATHHDKKTEYTS